MFKIQNFDYRIHFTFCEPKIVEKPLRITEKELLKHGSIFMPVFAHVKNTENRAENYRLPKMLYPGDPARKLNNYGLMERAFMCRL